MKIPNYVLDLIVKRRRYVEKAMDNAVSLQDWLDKHGIQIEDEDSVGGYEMFSNPYESARRVMNAILEKE